MTALQFAREFERLKSRLEDAPSNDVRLLLLMQFWSKIQPNIGQPQYSSFLDEYNSRLAPLITADNLYDFTLEEHVLLSDMLTPLKLHDSLPIVTKSRIRLHCYIGDIEKAASLCAKLFSEIIDPERITKELKANPYAAERSYLKAVSNLLVVSAPQTSKYLKTILTEWQEQSETLHHDRVHCLLVESGRLLPEPRGRLRLLCGAVRPFKASLFNGEDLVDEVIYEHQLRAPDDPAIGAVYQALKAVRSLPTEFGLPSGNNSLRLSARYHIPDTDHTITGDSIGLAAGVVAFIQLLQPELLRHERFVSLEAAFTGSIDSRGKVLQVREQTLQFKIRRAFFSQVKYLIVPRGNSDSASNIIRELNEQYPRRKLQLVAVDSLADVIEDRNIVRAEKVCLGQFVVRRAVKYSRATSVQLPLLLVLLYALISILYPKAWIGFDWNPQYVSVTAKGFKALNKDSVEVWSIDYDCESIGQKSDGVLFDVDNDDFNEILFAPASLTTESCGRGAYFYLYDDDGSLLFYNTSVTLGQYPGDSTLDIYFVPNYLAIRETLNGIRLITCANKDNPSREHIKLWDVSGNELGWYINAGSALSEQKLWSIDKEGNIVAGGINNRMGAASLFVLPPESFYGVSPPYQDATYDLGRVLPGNQIHYIIIPPSDLNKAQQALYNGPNRVLVFSDGSVQFETSEHFGFRKPSLLGYWFDSTFRVTKIDIHDSFKSGRNTMVAENLLDSVDWNKYASELLNAVTYWTDSGWVTEGQLRAIADK